MRARIISLVIILFVAFILAFLGLSIKREKAKIRQAWSWPKFKK